MKNKGILFITIFISSFLIVPVLSILLIWNFYPKLNQIGLLLINAVFLLILQCIVYILTFSLRRTLISCTLINWILFSLDEIVYCLKKTHAMPGDVYALRTVFSVTDNYEFNFSIRLFWTTAAMMVLIALILFVTKRIKNYEKEFFKKRKLKTGFLIVVVSIALVFFLVRLEPSDFTIDHYDSEITNRQNGLILSFYINALSMMHSPPEGYSTEAAIEGLLAYPDDTLTISDNQTLPNVIIVMDEAFSDLSMLGDLQTNEDPLEYCHLLNQQDNVISGKMDVSVWGGYTCNTEFEVLTGNSLFLFNGFVIPYNNLISENTDSLCSYFHTLGYTNIAIHPFWGQCWRRDIVYGQLGFDRFITAQEFTSDGEIRDAQDFAGRGGYDFGGDLEYIREYISDKESFLRVIEEFEAKEEDERVFIFNVTMQNHGDYTYAGDNIEYTISSNRVQDSYVNQYLSLVDRTDEALEMLIQYFETVDEPVVILFFGDHQPGLRDNFYDTMFETTEDSYTVQDQQMKYTVPYYIWANYDLNDVSYPELSTNYLAMALKDAAGLPMDSYDHFLYQLYDSYPAMTGRLLMQDNGLIFSKGCYWSEELSEYQLYQYYRMFE